MTRKFFYSLASAFVVLIGHVVYTIYQNKLVASRWANTGDRDWLRQYFVNGDHFLGLAYGMAIGFFVYILLTFFSMRHRGVYSFIGGVSLSGTLYGASCFLVGCCGSPMLAVYAAIFGVSFLGFTKPIIFLITFISVLGGLVYFNKKNKKETEACCSTGTENHCGESNVS